MSTVVTLFTGLQGNGKTLFAIELMQKFIAQGRTIYQNGIPGLKLDHVLLEDPEKWYEVPSGSVVFIDEAQRVFPGRHSSVKPPLKCTEFETLRKRGLEVVLITQHPNLLDSHVRNLIGRHIHVERMSGFEAAQLLEWQKCKTNPDSKSERRVAEFTTRKYPTALYELYESAEVHTIKSRVPAAAKYLGYAMVFGVVAIGGAAWHFTHNKLPVEQAASASVPDGTKPSKLSDGELPGGKRQVMTAVEYYQVRMPRIMGLPHTAPVYDGVMEPRRAPKPVACVATAKRCSCYSQEGTKMPTVDESVCRDMAANGYFDDTVEDGDRGAMSRGGAERSPPTTAQGAASQSVSSITDLTGAAAKWPIGHVTKGSGQ